MIVLANATRDCWLRKSVDAVKSSSSQVKIAQKNSWSSHPSSALHEACQLPLVCDSRRSTSHVLGEFATPALIIEI